MGSSLSSFVSSDLPESEPAAMNHSPVVRRHSTMSIDEQRTRLTMARALLAQSRPTEALEHVVAIVRSRGGGEASVLAFLDRAKADNADATVLSPDRLALFLSRLAIDGNDNDNHGDDDDDMSSVAASQASILEDQGRSAILRDAWQDGSSVLCPQCNGLIKASRFEKHQRWCDAEP